MIPDSVLSDAETDSDAPLEADDSDLYEGGEDGAAEQKQDNKDDSMLRWQQIKHFFKCSDPNTEEEEMQKGNQLVKVQAFFDAFIQACKTFYLAAQCIALDDTIKAFKGRCLFKQYIKSKLVKWGIKNFFVCCSITGDLLNAEFLLGKMSDNEE